MAMDPTSKSKTDKQQSAFWLGCILKMAAAASVTLPQESQAVYLENLASLTREQIEQATARTIREWDKPNMMPPIKFILDRSGVNPQLAAEQAWDWTQRYYRRHWHIDIGHLQGAPEIPPATEYAIRQVGGLRRIAYPEDGALDFIRKGFLEAHQRFALEDGQQVRLSHNDAKRLLDTLRTAQTSGFSELPAVVERTDN